MIILLILLAALLSMSIIPIFLDHKDNFLVTITQVLMVTLIAKIIAGAFYQHDIAVYTLGLLDFNHITLALSIQLDRLAVLMLLFILTIGLLIYRYAQNYLASDHTRIRFLSQLNLVVLSVLLLAMSANLLTAFVAWQLIGISLYLLLNHYHYNPSANRVAKKKFVINRLGDSSFLLAVVLAYHTHSGASFNAIQSSAHAGLICSLLFISVMTKCAQFPFHIWLVDTMEAPTPVSALMHAGIINAGGILLARVSGTLIHFHGLNYFILLTGLISAGLSIHWMNQQPDTKKKLAYSTMGQMGYMLTQCGLGAFPAAIFHLMSHGFYKASLFLNAGETLTTQYKRPRQAISHLMLVKAFMIALLIFFLGLWLLGNHNMHLPLLSYGFILLTIISLVLKSEQITLSHWSARMPYYFIIGIIFFTYFFLLHVFSHLIPQYDHAGVISPVVQIMLIVMIFCFQTYLWVSSKGTSIIKIRDKTEFFVRQFLLQPLRSAGNVVNNMHYRKTLMVVYIGAILFTVVGFSYGLSHHFSVAGNHAAAHQWPVFIFLLIGIVALIVANRCLSIRLLIAYLVLFELAFTNIALYDGSNSIFRIGIFHIVNMSSALFMLAFLARKYNKNKVIIRKSNRLPTRVFYLVFSLLLLIGIPGTASFISEFYLLNALTHNNILCVLMYISLIILLAIVIMHSLQLYAFNKNYSALLLRPIMARDHFIFLTVIIINIACGLWPNILLHHL